MTQTLTKRTIKKKRTRMGFGSQGWATLKACYQLGGLTGFQHSRLFGIPVQKSYRVLANLADQRLLEQAPIQTPGRPRDFNYLSKTNGSRGILLGGYEAGVRERLVLSGYKRFQLPAAVEHRHMCNEYLLSLREAAEADPEVEVPLNEMWGEGNPSFPLRGEAMKKSDRTNAREVYEKIYPDGVFEVRFDSNLSCRYYLEYESRSRPSHVLAKLDAYGAHFHRLLNEDEAKVGDWIRPIIFLFPQGSTTVHVAQVVAEAIRNDAPGLSRFMAWWKAGAKKGSKAGRLVLFASLEDLQAHGALSARYGVVQRYPEGGLGVAKNRTQVSLEAVAEEIDEVVSKNGEE